MSARVLVVDDIPANLKLLEARLGAEYFDVVTAASGAEALAACAKALPDIILLDVMMPGMDGFEVCRRLKASVRTAHIPIVIVTALDQPSDRIKGLEAGADDFLTKPVSDVALITRVRSLTRLKMLTDELRHRFDSSRSIGFDGRDPTTAEIVGTAPGRVLVVDDRRSSYERVAGTLRAFCEVDVEPDGHEALMKLAEGDYELVVISAWLDGQDALRLCSQLRSLERTRMLPILLIIDAEDTVRLNRALDIGINDYLVRPVDRQELTARVRTQIQRKRLTDYLRSNVQHTFEMAVTDALTGLHNRRYMETHLATLVAKAGLRARPLSVLILDVDHFKMINDTFGHDVGDDVLREVAERMRAAVRGIDLVCRLGGEEFVVVMPDTDMPLAVMVAERLRHRVASEPFMTSRGTRNVEITASIGIGALVQASDTPELILKRADEALYRAKKSGRNCVVTDAA